MQMPRGIRYSEEFKRDAVAQVTERGYSVQEVSDRLGITTKSLYDWRSKFEQPKQQTDQDIEVRRLKAELIRVTEERDILKKATAYFAKDAK
jgi:transposase